jgi:hypothetical protein
MRAILPDTLPLLVQVYNAATHSFSHQVWGMNLPGCSLCALTTLAIPPGYAMNETSQFPWSNLAHNGNAATSVQSMLVGSLAAGPANAVAMASPGNSTAGIAGWTTHEPRCK